jgi:DNA-binding MarR family transcriptional regulator
MERRKESTKKLAALGAVIDETRSLFHGLKAVANELHADDRISAGKRGVLLSLHHLGPQTVPQMARARPVSRQHIQSLVNPLSEAGYVEFVENPVHRGSPLVRMTKSGIALTARILEREAEPLSRAVAQVSQSELETTIETLKKINAFFQSGKWRGGKVEKRSAP